VSTIEVSYQNPNNVDGYELVDIEVAIKNNLSITKYAASTQTQYSSCAIKSLFKKKV